MLWHTIYLGQQLWGALCSFAPHLCHPLDISQINHIPRLRQYTLVWEREKRGRIKFAVGGLVSFLSFTSWAMWSWCSACNSGAASVNSFFLSGVGRHSLFNMQILHAWGSQRNIQSSVFDTGRSKFESVSCNAHVQRYWNNLFQEQEVSQDVLCGRRFAVLFCWKYKNIFKVNDHREFCVTCSVAYYRQNLWGRVCYFPK